MRKQNVIWEPHAGSQTQFLSCPADEVLIAGNRGGGKTDCLLMDYLQHVGQGYGADWRGIIFRQEYTQLIDVINKCNKWIPQIFPGSKYNGSEHKWTFPTGELLYLRNMRRPEDYWSYHGWEIPFLGWEELTNWATDECYLTMMSTNRSSNPHVPRKIRSSCNPSGAGHGWVKQRFIDPMPPLSVFFDKETEKTRVHIPSALTENTTLLEADPGYVKTIIASVQDDPVKYKAWVLGEWDIIAGGFFTDVWDRKIHVLPHFKIPGSWYVFRSFDWGSSKPWSISYIAECNGEQPDPVDGIDIPYFPKGAAIVINEIYGWNGTVNEGDRATSQEIAERTLQVDKNIENEFKVKVHPGPADINIFEVRDGVSMSQTMNRHGLYWRRAYKGSGSRIAGWGLMRTMLGSAKRLDLEHGGLYFFEQARHHIRTIPIQQTDPKKPEDLDSDLEDHACDSLRYGLARKLTVMKRRKVRY